MPITAEPLTPEADAVEARYAARALRYVTADELEVVRGWLAQSEARHAGSSYGRPAELCAAECLAGYYDIDAARAVECRATLERHWGVSLAATAAAERAHLDAAPAINPAAIATAMQANAQRVAA